MTGLLHFPDPLSVAVALLAGALLLGQPARIAVAVVAALAIARGAGLREAAATHCAAVLPLGEQRVEVLAVDPGAGMGRVRLRSPRCPGVLTARWPAGSEVPAGATAVVTARWRPRAGVLGHPEGTLSIRRVHAVVRHAGLVTGSRTAVMRAIHHQFGSRAALVEALLTGRRGGLDREVTDAFAASGMIHLLAISGFHVGLLVGWVLLLAGAAGLPPRRGGLIAAVIALGYAAWLGWPPPATRAAVFVALLVAMRRRQRSVGISGLVGACAVVVLVLDPWAVARVGAWLSFAAITGVVWATRWARHATRRVPAFRDALAASIGATLATAPIAALVLGRVAVIGPLLNLIAMPLVALAVPGAALAVLLDPLVPAVAGAFAHSTSLLLGLLAGVAGWGAALPGAAVDPTPGPAAALPWSAVLAIALCATWRRTSVAEAARRAGWGAAVLLWAPLLGGSGLESGIDGRLTLHFLDVGQGDAVAIRTPAGRWTVIDAGPADDRWDAGARVVVPWLRRMGAHRIEVLVVSHPHRDHVGGVPAVLDALPVGLIVGPGEPFRERHYLGMLAFADTVGVRWHPVRAGEGWQLDGVTFRVLHPAEGWPGQGLDLNEDSVVLEVRYGAFTALLTGDAGTVAESSYVAGLDEVDLLKVGHHGSRGATGEVLLAAVRPVAAVVSSGTNRYGHPAAEALGRLARHGVAVWRTDREGHVSVATNGRDFTVRGGRHAATFDAGELNHGDTACCMQPR